MHPTYPSKAILGGVHSIFVLPYDLQVWGLENKNFWYYSLLQLKWYIMYFTY